MFHDPAGGAPGSRRPAAALVGLVGLAGGLLAAGCQAQTPSAPPAQGSSPTAVSAAVSMTASAGAAGGAGSAATAGGLTRVAVGLPYKPDVQFAPLYVAKEAGYYKAEGLDVEFRYGDEADFVQLVGGGKLDATIAGGDQVIQARAGGVPVKYVLTWYQRFPVGVFSGNPALDKPSALVGHKVGLPAASGASFLGWQAFLKANKIAADQVPTEVVGYNQVEALDQGRVEAAVGYVVNEPLRLKAEGKPVTVIEIADTFNLVSNGLVVSEADTKLRRPLIQSLVKATLLGLRDTLDEPDAALTMTLEAVPELADPAQIESARTVLKASLRLWDSEFGLGVIDSQAWQASVQFLREQGIIKTVPTLDELLDLRFVPDANVPIVR